MDDRSFFDLLLQVWAKTTGAEDRYWKPLDDGRIVAVGKDESELDVAHGVSEEDAEFITGLHGCLADLVRRLHQAVDEADRLDRDMDAVQARLAQLELGRD